MHYVITNFERKIRNIKTFEGIHKILPKKVPKYKTQDKFKSINYGQIIYIAYIKEKLMQYQNICGSI